MNKLYVIGGIFVLVIVCFIFIIINRVDKNELEEQKVSYSEEDAIEMVDQMIRDLTKSDEFLSADEEKRKEMSYQLLKHLKNSELIKNFKFQEKSHMYSFEYIDGTTGGISLKDFSSNSMGGVYLN